MDRRKTLAGLSPAQLNARVSLAPRGMAGKGGAAAGGKLPIEKALSRMSLAGPVTRRSSAYTTSKATGLKSDPRPVSDKGFQQACIRTVIAYLAAHGFEYAITPKARRASASAAPPRALHHTSRGRLAGGVQGAGRSLQQLEEAAAACHLSPAAACVLPSSCLFLARAGAGQPHHQGLHQCDDVPVPPV